MARYNFNLSDQGVRMSGLMARVVLDLAIEGLIEVELERVGNGWALGNIIVLSFEEATLVCDEMGARFEAGQPAKTEQDIAWLHSNIDRFSLLHMWVTDFRNEGKKLVFA